MAYTALYRKFRPTTFSDVKGQDHIVRTLTNQIKSDRIGHAYLFCGTRGTGKTSVAKVLARAINCENPVDGNPCNECAVCKSILGGTSMNVVEIDAASNNGVDNIRQIVEEVKYSPTEGSYRVYIIDEVHMLSSGAFNALLKTLEEPPSYVVFILATTEAHMIPITILSRCQRYDFKRISIETITARLRELCDKEGISATDEALRYVAKCGEGSMRDSLSLLDRCIAFYFEEELTFDKVLDILGTTEVDVFAVLLRCIDSGNVEDCLKTIEQQVIDGRDLSRFIVDFTWYMRNLILAGTGKNISELLEVSSEQMEILFHEAKIFSQDQLMRYISACCELTNKLRYATQKRVLVETELIKLCKPQMVNNDEALKDRIRRLEAEIENIRKTGVALPVDESNVVAEENGDVEYYYIPEEVPKDLQKVVEDWDEIGRNVGGTLKISIKSKHLYPSTNSEDKLLLVFTDQMDYLSIADKNVKDCVERRQALFKVLAKYGVSEQDVIFVAPEEEGTSEGKKHADVRYLQSLIPGVPIETT